jgi:hypothetical protein
VSKIVEMQVAVGLNGERDSGDELKSDSILNSKKTRIDEEEC